MPAAADSTAAASASSSVTAAPSSANSRPVASPMPPAAAGDERHAAGHAARHQASVSWSPALTTMRAMAPWTQLSPGASTTEADRTRKERGSAPGAGVP